MPSGEPQIALSIYDLDNSWPSTTTVYGPIDDSGAPGGDNGSAPQYYSDPQTNNAFINALNSISSLDIQLGTDTISTDAGSDISGVVVASGGFTFFFGNDSNGAAFGVKPEVPNLP